MTPKPRRILIVAPDVEGLTKLDVIPEIDTIQDLGYEVRVLQGDVPEERLSNAARTMRQVDIIHFASHSDARGVALSDGILSAGGILQIARQCNAQLIFLNSCKSARLGQLLVDNDIPSVIATLDDTDGSGIPDAIARSTAQTFYVMLAKLNDVHSAYKASKPAGDGWYVFLANGGYTNAMTFPMLERFSAIDELIVKNATAIESTAKSLEQMIAVAAADFAGREAHAETDKSEILKALGIIRLWGAVLFGGGILAMLLLVAHSLRLV